VRAGRRMSRRTSGVCVATLVLNRMRAFQGAIGLAATAGLVTPEYMVLRASPAADSRYLHYLFKSSWFVGQMTSRLRGIGTAEQGNVRTPRVYWGDLGSIEVLVPSLERQRGLADSLDHETARIDALIERKQRLVALSTDALDSYIAAQIDQASRGASMTRLRRLASVAFSSVDKKTREGEQVIRLCNYTDVYERDEIVDDPSYMVATRAPVKLCKSPRGDGSSSCSTRLLTHRRSAPPTPRW